MQCWSANIKYPKDSGVFKKKMSIWKPQTQDMNRLNSSFIYRLACQKRGSELANTSSPVCLFSDSQAHPSEWLTPNRPNLSTAPLTT